MRMEEARALVFQTLRGGKWNQFGELLMAVGMLKAKAEKLDTRTAYDGRQFLSEPEKSLIMEIVWSLIVQGILIPALNDANQGWPFLRLTEYGQKCVQEDRILPHDPEGYLQDFYRDIPNADSTVVEYLTESLQCFIHGLYRAAAVMIGGASEQAILLLIEGYGNAIADSRARERYETDIQKAPSIFRKYQEFERQLPEIKRQAPRQLTDNIDSQLRGIFDLIRNTRNDAGHPASGAVVDRDIIYSHLRLFTPYYKRISDLTEWFASRGSGRET
jgi:hypothetical protein